LPKENVEVVIGKNRADIVTSYGEVCELQNSGISGDEIESRNVAYKGPIWLFNGTDGGDRFELKAYYGPWQQFDAIKKMNAVKLEHGEEQSCNIYRWSNPRKPWLWAPSGKLFIDLGSYVLYILSHPKSWESQQGPCLIAGFPISKQQFIEGVLLSNTLYQNLIAWSKEISLMLQNQHPEFGLCNCDNCDLGFPLLSIRKFVICVHCSKRLFSHGPSKCSSKSMTCPVCKEKICNQRTNQCLPMCGQTCTICKTTGDHALCATCKKSICAGISGSSLPGRCEKCLTEVCSSCSISVSAMGQTIPNGRGGWRTTPIPRISVILPSPSPRGAPYRSKQRVYYTFKTDRLFRVCAPCATILIAAELPTQQIIDRKNSAIEKEIRLEELKLEETRQKEDQERLQRWQQEQQRWQQEQEEIRQKEELRQLQESIKMVENLLQTPCSCGNQNLSDWKKTCCNCNKQGCSRCMWDRGSSVNICRYGCVKSN
jgi:hypothetical protein